MNLYSNLISYWKMDESSGTIVDAHGSNDGTYNGALYSQDGKINTAIGFDGNDDYIDIGDVLDMGTNDFSISAWVKSASLLPDNKENQVINKKSLSTDVYEGYFLCMPNGQFRFQIADGTNYLALTVGSVGEYNNNNWHHVIAVANRGTELRIYVDGVSVGNVTETTIGNIDTNNLLSIGNAYYSGSSHVLFNGSIDEVGVWNRALTPTEMEKLYNSNAGLPYSLFGNSTSLNLNGTLTPSGTLVPIPIWVMGVGGTLDLSGALTKRNPNWLLLDDTLTWMGEWDANYSYNVDDTVLYKTAGAAEWHVFVSKTGHNVSNTPTTSAANWRRLYQEQLQ